MKIIINEINLAGIVFAAGQALKLEETYDVVLKTKDAEILLKVAVIDEEPNRYRAVFRELSDVQVSALKTIVQGFKPTEISAELSESKGEK